MKKKAIKKIFHGEMDSYKEKLVVRFMSEKATAQAYSYLDDHIKELKLTGDDAEKLPWVNRQADNLCSKAMNESMRHSNIAYGIKIALEGVCDELAIEVYDDYAMLIVDPDSFEVDPFSYVADCGVSILDDPLNSFAKLRKKYLELANKISKAKADMDDAKDDGVVAEITSVDDEDTPSKQQKAEWLDSFEELIQNANAGNSSDAVPAEESPKEAPSEESPVEEESHE
jgi:hypothetical protein|nr:MAG TPA: hypothetical protein [Caudoviricetes sp.]